MKYTTFASTGIVVPRLAFGCAPVMGRVGPRHAVRAMQCAFDGGVSHFDIARSYGFGDAEDVLGKFCRGRRHQVTITSKFGVVPPELRPLLRHARPVARGLRRLSGPLQRRMRRLSGALLTADPLRFDSGYARTCLHASLRALGTDYIDFYLLHDPIPEALVNAHELMAFLEQSRQAGKIRAWGLAWRDAASCRCPLPPGAQVLQVEGNIRTAQQLSPLFARGQSCFITRPFEGGPAANDAGTGAALPEAQAMMRELGPHRFSLGLALALSGRAGSVITSMFSEKHIRENLAALDQVLAMEHDFGQLLYLLAEHAGTFASPRAHCPTDVRTTTPGLFPTR
jgi:aryl-alcohol dehydrogenase-like predicted oxidoreductase